MKKTPQQTLCLLMAACLTLWTACERGEIVVDIDCGVIDTTIEEIHPAIGSYMDSAFSFVQFTDFETAAIQLMVDEVFLGQDCFAWTPNPQLIASISITSSGEVFSGSSTYAAGENLNELFKLHNGSETYDIPGFINAQMENPLLFATYEDSIVLQLLNKPDELINQTFEISFTFDDGASINVETPVFEVSN